MTIDSCQLTETNERLSEAGATYCLEAYLRYSERTGNYPHPGPSHVRKQVARWLEMKGDVLDNTGLGEGDRRG